MTFWQDKDIIATGGSGFLGSHVVEKLTPHNPKSLTLIRQKDYNLTEQSDVRKCFQVFVKSWEIPRKFSKMWRNPPWRRWWWWSGGEPPPPPLQWSAHIQTFRKIRGGGGESFKRWGGSGGSGPPTLLGFRMTVVVVRGFREGPPPLMFWNP